MNDETAILPGIKDEPPQAPRNPLTEREKALVATGIAIAVAVFGVCALGVILGAFLMRVLIL